MLKKISDNFIIFAIIFAVILISGTLIYQNYRNREELRKNNFEELSSEEAGEKVIDYINTYLLEGAAEASLTEVLEENGLYRVKLKIGENNLESYVSKDGKLLFPEAIDLTKNITEPIKEIDITIGYFSVADEEICQEDGKPIIYFFGSESCPHCTWEHPVVESLAEKFGEGIAFHNNMGMENDEEVFSKYNPEGGVPVIILGCRYYRVGSGETLGTEEELRNLTALTCKLTDNQPADVCNSVQDLVEQIEY